MIELDTAVPMEPAPTAVISADPLVLEVTVGAKEVPAAVREWLESAGGEALLRAEIRLRLERRAR